MTTRLETEIAEAERKLTRLRAEREREVAECEHSWGPVIADHIVTGGYTSPGDPPGTMGIDWRGPVFVPRETKHRWKRVCRKCNKVEHTTDTDKRTTETPRFHT